MSVDLVIKNAKIVTPRSIYEAGLAVQDGVIVAIGVSSQMPDAKQVIDAEGRYLIPGAVDVHVHFRDPGLTYKEDFSTGTSAAAVGGVTTAFDMPNTNPAVLTAEVLLEKNEIAKKKALVNYGLYAFMQKGNEGDLEPLIEAGVCGFKWDMSTFDWELPEGYSVPDNDSALQAFRTIAKHPGYIIGVHAEDMEIVGRLVEDLKEAGRTDYHAHVESRPDFVEVSAIERALRLSDITGAPIHIHHLTSKAGLQLIKDRQQTGSRVTSEAGPPWLFFSADQYADMGALIRVIPAVKESFDRDALWQGLVDGGIECYATDHAPHSHEEKFERTWHDALPGATGVETSIPTLLDKANKGEISMERVVEVSCENPARIFGLYPRKGSIQVGADADLVLVDMDVEWTIKNEEIHSKNHITPFDGWEIKGRPMMTFVNGDLVAHEGKIVTDKTPGKLVNPKQEW